MTIQKLFCKIMLRSFVLILGLISVTELSANPEFVYSASSLESSVTAPQGGGDGQKAGWASGARPRRVYREPP
mgnify:CR=1 FL=1